MRDPQQRERQRAIAPPPSSSSNGEGRSSVYAPSSIWTLGVVRDVGRYVNGSFVSGTGDVIRWQRIRYKRGQVPTVGQYTAYGKFEDGYPQETRAGGDYTSLKVTGTPTVSSTVVRVAWRHGFWIIELLGGGGSGTVFPVLLSKTSGSGGSAGSPASWRYRVASYPDGTLLATDVSPTVVIDSLDGGYWVRPTAGMMTFATFGYASRKSNGKIMLGWINEQVVQEVCSS